MVRRHRLCIGWVFRILCQQTWIQNRLRFGHNSKQQFISHILPWKQHNKDFLHRPPNCAAAGRLKIHSISCWDVYLSIHCLFHPSSAALSSCSPAWKLVPLSLQTTWGLPRLDINLCIALMKEWMSKECAISMWTTLVVKQVNIYP